MSVYANPRLPASLLRPLTELRAPTATYSPENGGQYIPGAPARIAFRGCIMPIGQDDLRRAEAGTFGANSRKIYTNGHKLRKGAQIEDDAGDVYTITGDLDHTGVSPIGIYYAERKEVAAPQ